MTCQIFSLWLCVCAQVEENFVEVVFRCEKKQEITITIRAGSPKKTPAVLWVACYRTVVPGVQGINTVHCKKRLAILTSPAGMSLTKLSLAGNKFVPARESLG